MILCWMMIVDAIDMIYPLTSVWGMLLGKLCHDDS